MDDLKKVVNDWLSKAAEDISDQIYTDLVNEFPVDTGAAVSSMSMKKTEENEKMIKYSISGVKYIPMVVYKGGKRGKAPFQIDKILENSVKKIKLKV